MKCVKCGKWLAVCSCPSQKAEGEQAKVAYIKGPGVLTGARKRPKEDTRHGK